MSSRAATTTTPVTSRADTSHQAILMVGGLGACNYLYQELRTEYQATNTQKTAISVLQPSGARPWTAICRGAVIRGLSATEPESVKRSLIVARVSRWSYGIVFTSPWDATKHDPQDKFWDAQELKHKADNQMEWYLARVRAPSATCLLPWSLTGCTGRRHAS